MAAVLLKISTVSFVLAGVALVIAVYVAIRFNIKDVINDLSGKTARTSIERVRAYNEKTGVKFFRSSSVNIERGALTDAISTKKFIDTGSIKNRIGKNKSKSEAIVDNNHKTDNPDLDYETGVINENVAKYDSSETTGVLIENQSYEAAVTIEDETDILDDSVARPSRAKSSKVLEMIDEVIVTHD